MLEFSDVAVTHAIELVVAPVFLLTGIGAILAVMTNRLGRVIDRASRFGGKAGRSFPGGSLDTARDLSGNHNPAHRTALKCNALQLRLLR